MACVIRGMLCAGILALMGGAALANCAAPDLRTAEPPSVPGGGPVEVGAAFVLVDFLGVDDVEQQITVDLRFTLTWTDPRLADFVGCRFRITEVWAPQLTLVNSSNLRVQRQQARDQVSVGEGGAVSYVQRVSGDISSYHQLQDFPFDRHDFEIRALDPEIPAETLRFVPDAAGSGTAQRLNLEGWTLIGAALTEAVNDGPLLQRPASMLTLTIEAERQSTYYVFRILLPLLFVVAMSWAIFWVPPARYEFQIGLGATSMLTAIAFTLSIAGQLPQLGYLTQMDQMLIWAVFLVFLSIIEALATGLLVLQKREAMAARLDRVCRVAIPSLLLVGWAIFLL